MIKSVSLDDETIKKLNEIKDSLSKNELFEDELNDSYVIRLLIRYYYSQNVKKK